MLQKWRKPLILHYPVLKKSKKSFDDDSEDDDEDKCDDDMSKLHVCDDIFP